MTSGSVCNWWNPTVFFFTFQIFGSTSSYKSPTITSLVGSRTVTIGNLLSLGVRFHKAWQSNQLTSIRCICCNRFRDLREEK
jgi:hypothetical protein